MQVNVLMRLAAVFLSLVTGVALADAISIEDLARVPAIQTVSMSSDGKQLVAIVSAPGSDYQDTALASWDLDEMDKGPVVTPSGDRMKFIAASALKAGKVLVAGRQEWSGSLGGCGEGKLLGTTHTFVFKTYLTDGKHGDFEEAFAEGGSRRFGVSKRVERCLEIAGSAGLVNQLPLDPSKVIIQRTDALSLRADYYLYDLATGDTELLLLGAGRTSPGLFNPRDGKLLVRTDLEQTSTDEYESRFYILNPDNGEFELHQPLTTKLSERHSVSIQGIDEATGRYYVLTDQFSDYVQAWMYDPKTKSFGDEPLVAHPQFNIGRLIFGEQPSNFMQLIGFEVNGPEPEVTYVDPQMRSIHDGLKNTYKGQHVAILDYNDDLSRILFETGSARNPPAYHLLNDRKSVTTLGGQRPWIDPEDLGEQRWITYKARDGLEIPAILDLPAGWSEEDGPLPTVVHPHGGPWSRDFGGWDVTGWVPFLTSRGYAVLRPEYRGSDGLGRKLWKAGDAEWGQAMQDDKDDGARWLVEQGIADPDRIAIFGYSYGGFAAAAATVRPDGPFQCAISGAPVTDLGRIGANWSDNRVQRILQGVTVRGMDPIDNTDKADIPILLYVGDRDVRTPKWHAEDFYGEVKDKVPAKLEVIEDMPHQLPWYYRHHKQTLALIENFLAKDCGFAAL